MEGCERGRVNRGGASVPRAASVRWWTWSCKILEPRLGMCWEAFRVYPLVEYVGEGGAAGGFYRTPNQHHPSYILLLYTPGLSHRSDLEFVPDRRTRRPTNPRDAQTGYLALPPHRNRPSTHKKQDAPVGSESDRDVVPSSEHSGGIFLQPGRDYTPAQPIPPACGTIYTIVSNLS